MMAAIFAAMLAGLGLGWAGRRGWSAAALLLCLGLAVWLFLWEVWSPEYGFRMPWIDVRLAPAAQGPG